MNRHGNETKTNNDLFTGNQGNPNKEAHFRKMAKAERELSWLRACLIAASVEFEEGDLDKGAEILRRAYR